MMKFVLLLTGLWLTGCAKEEPPPPPPAGPSVTARNLEILADTKSHQEATLLAAAGALVREGGSLDPAATSRCWAAEARRPRVREACLLAWGAGTAAENAPETAEFSATLKSLLTGDLSRNEALALARRADFVAGLTWAELLRLLGFLKSEPSWLRSATALAWLARNPAPAPVESHELWALIAPPGESTDPYTLGETFRLAQKLGGGQAAALTAAYCAPLTTGVAQSRCLRFLSSLVDPRTKSGLPDDLRLFLPRRNDQGWIFFARAFPDRAPLLEPYL